MCFLHFFFQTRTTAIFKYDICSQNENELKTKSMLRAMETRIKKSAIKCMSEKERLLLLYMKPYSWMAPTAAIKAVDSPRIIWMLMSAINRMLRGVRNLSALNIASASALRLSFL